MNHFTVDVLTPNKVIARNIPAESLLVPTVEGQINILSGHTHIIAKLETGTISVCYRGRLSRGLDREKLERFLSALLLRHKSKESVWARAKEQLDLTPEGIAKSENMAKQDKQNV